MSISIVVTPLEGWSCPIVTRPFCEDLGTRLTLVYNVVGVVNPIFMARAHSLSTVYLCSLVRGNTVVSNVGGCGKP